jgi:hypothetical protein
MSSDGLGFFSQFRERELKKVTLETMKDYSNDVIFLRGLSRSDTSYFREMGARIKAHRSIAIMTKDDSLDKLELDFQRAEDYLLMKSICNEGGKLIFTEAKDLREWLDDAPNEVVNEIVYHIREMNILDSSCPQSRKEAQEAEHSKKSNAL